MFLNKLWLHIKLQIALKNRCNIDNDDDDEDIFRKKTNIFRGQASFRPIQSIFYPTFDRKTSKISASFIAPLKGKWLPSQFKHWIGVKIIGES